ncbi:hemagglutinin [Bacillus mycoides]|uniref:Hemagglutinin n=1 Tax=Bacillus mycoides TaxID=1405 RepID=A0A1S9T052_BACMY|nr:hemagglutinin [Bacillus mycoides]OOR03394.1 hemagglutinin [Bacillus mycoides]
MPLNYENLYKKMGIVFLGGSLILGTTGCSWFGSKESSKSKSAITKKVDKSKPEEKKENLNKQDFEAMTENAIQSKDNEVAYVLEELDKSKINFKEKSIVSNLQNGDETTSRVLALFDKETKDKTLQDTTKDNVIAAITDNKPQVTLNGDHFAFGDQNIESSVASIGDILPPVTPEGENGNTENTGTEKPKPTEPEEPTDLEKPKPPVNPPTEPEKPKPPVDPPVDPPTEPEKPKPPVDPPVDPPTDPEKPKPPVDPPTDPEKPKPPVDPPTDPEKPKPPVDPPTNPEKQTEPKKPTNPEKPTELNKQESKSDVTV